MTSSSKRRGDRAELEIARILEDLLGYRIRRKLGAGRTDDTGDLDAALDHGRLLGVRPVCSSCGLPRENRVHGGQLATLVPVVGVKPERALELLDDVAGDLAKTPGYTRLRSAFAAALAEANR